MSKEIPTTERDEIQREMKPAVWDALLSLYHISGYSFRDPCFQVIELPLNGCMSHPLVEVVRQPFDSPLAGRGWNSKGISEELRRCLAEIGLDERVARAMSPEDRNRGGMRGRHLCAVIA